MDIGDFYGANFQGTDLKIISAAYACFIIANVGGANLERAFLLQANFEGAKLIGANLEGAMLEGANLRGADLEGAKLQGADLQPGLSIGRQLD